MAVASPGLQAWVLIVLAILNETLATERPNILLIMADDLGIGDVGCFGNDTLRTPNIDRLAREGVRLDHHLAAASMCTPSRTAFLTGRYPIRAGMVSHDVFRVNFFLSATSGLPPNETTIGEVAQQAGYTTGLIGKWHLGVNCAKQGDFCHHPLNQGFDYYYGVPLTNMRDYANDGLTLMNGRSPRLQYAVLGLILASAVFAHALHWMGVIQRKTAFFIVLVSLIPIIVIQYVLYMLKHWNPAVMRNFDVVEQPFDYERITDRLVSEGSQFLRSRYNDKKPFLLIMSWIQVHTALHATSPFKGRSAHGPYGDEVEEMDWSVGQILEALDRFDLTGDTFVLFTSDQGGHVEEVGVHGNREGGWNGIFKGGKGQGGMEGGIRVPAVARWPSVIPAGSAIEVPTSMMDVMPTVAAMIQVEAPTDRAIDGKNILPLLKGDSSVGPPHEFLVHYCGDVIHAARYVPGDGSDVYKIHLATPNWLPGTEGCGFLCDCAKRITLHNPPLMYNIARDPSEKTRLNTNDPKYKPILGKMLDLLSHHKGGVLPVASQFRWPKLVPRPWLQPCCNFPYCSCKEAGFGDKLRD